MPSFLLPRLLLCFVLSLCGPLAGAQQSATAPPAADSFFERAAFAEAQLSPNGKYLAARAGAKGHHDILMVIELATKKAEVVESFEYVDVKQFAWVNDERLVFTIETSRGTSLYGVNRDGSMQTLLANERGMISGGLTSRPLLGWNTFLMDPCSIGKTDSIYVTHAEPDVSDEVRKVNLMLLNTRTGRGETAPRPGMVLGWALNQLGEPAVAVTEDRGVTTVLHRATGGKDWRTLASYRTYGGDAMIPLQFGPDGSLYVAAAAGKDQTAVYSWDFNAGRINPAPLVTMPGYDFRGSLVSNCDKVLGVRFVTDAAANEWFDPAMKLVQQVVDKLLPATVNLISVAARPEARWVLVRAYSDVRPETWWLFNTETQEISKLGSQHQSMDPAQMGRQQALRYKARDGLEIPALLTLPVGGKRKNLPLVVLVHGGPWVRGASWGWRAEPQFLASRGYAVLEPEFRGSTGFGYAHFHAGWKQWGLAMQDDIADGTRWAIAQGIADPKRICIAGASYGGYATLMGLVNDPELYQCGIEWVGVTDLNLLFNGSWHFPSDMGDRYKQYGFKELIGDPEKDAARFRATSPIEQAARITRPLLLAYGGLDRRVPITHGTRFRDAVSRTNPNLEWVEYPDEGHGWYMASTEVDFWTRVERFLDKHIGSGAAAKTGSAAKAN